MNTGNFARAARVQANQIERMMQLTRESLQKSAAEESKARGGKSIWSTESINRHVAPKRRL